MNYNELTFHKASPFYKQDFMPDRAWYNRNPKEFPSQIPSGKEYFVDSGRKHYAQRFNHSEIEEDKVLKSPQRYPFQNRIAMDKTYMRSLNTIDIEGASSNTRINQSIKYKYKAQDELARRYNQSVELAKKKQPTEQERRRDFALRQYQEFQQKKVRQQSSNSDSLQSSKVSSTVNPEYRQPSLKHDISQQYKRYVMQVSNNKFSKDVPQPKLQDDSLSSPMKYEKSYNTIDVNPSSYDMARQRSESLSNRPINTEPQPAPTPYSQYKEQYNAQKMRNNEEHQRILKYQEMTKRILQNPKDFRKNSPTNLSLSFNLAGQKIVGN